MADFEKMSDEQLENVTGGRERIVRAGSVNVRSGPGTDYGVVGECCRGDHVYTDDDRDPVYADGYTWYKLEGGGWIAGEFLD